MSHRVVVERHCGNIRYTSLPSGIRIQIHLPMGGLIDGEAQRKVLRSPEARS